MNAAARLALCAGITGLTVFGTLLASRSSRYVVGTHVGLEAYPRAMRDDPARLAAVADAHPEDWQLQLARAGLPHGLAEPGTAPRSGRLASLLTCFPAEPSISAAWLRWNVYERMRLPEAREYQPELHGGPARVVSFGNSAPTAEEIDRFNSVARRGEMLDPDNAFFPTMRACALFAGTRDAEAEQAILRAGKCHRWNDFAYDEPEAHYRLQRMTYGDRAQSIRMSTFSGALFPHLARIQMAARAGVRRARDLERRGQTKEGIALRHALARCGGLMRAEQTTRIGALVGSEITDLAMTDPGGVASRPGGDDRVAVATDETRPECLAAYTEYLRAHGMNTEATWTEAEAERANDARRILNDRSYGSSAVYESQRYGITWLAGAALLSSGLVVAILWGLTTVCAGITARGHSSAALALALCVTICVGMWQLRVVRAALQQCLILGLSATEDWMVPIPLAVPPGADVVMATAVVFPALLLALPLLRSGRTRRQSGRFHCGLAIPAGAAILFVLYGCSVALAGSSESHLRHYLDRKLGSEPEFAAQLMGMRWPEPPDP